MRLVVTPQQWAETIWPRINTTIYSNTATWWPAEGRQDPTLKTLDRIAGIDAMIEHGDQGWGVACRAQYWRGYATFTIRESIHGDETHTELHKRIRSLQSRSLMPEFAIQVYVDQQDPTQVIALAMVQTSALLLTAATRGQYQTKQTTAGDATFRYVQWQHLPTAKIIVNPP